MQEQHRLTPRERRIVLLVAVLTFIMVAAWIAAIVLVMPNPSHGTL